MQRVRLLLTVYFLLGRSNVYWSSHPNLEVDQSGSGGSARTPKASTFNQIIVTSSHRHVLNSVTKKMSTTRWSLRLPRTLATQRRSVLEGRLGEVGRIQRRGFIRRPPPKPRQAGRQDGQSNDKENENGVYNQKEVQKYQEFLRRLEEKRTAGQPQQPLPSPESQSQSQPHPPQQPEQAPDQTSPGRNSQLAATLAESDTSDLVTEVHIPDDTHGILPKHHPAMSILGNSALVIQRQVEWMNILAGFEQANRYVIMDGHGQTVGFIVEEDHGIGTAMKRQMLNTRRSFTTHIFDKYQREVLRIHRPFQWINSRIRIYDAVPEGGYAAVEQSTALQTTPGSTIDQASSAQVSPLKLDEMRIIGEAKQQWAPLRRKYNLFSYRPLEQAPENDTTPRIESGDKATSDTKALTVTESKTNDAAIEAGMQQFAFVNEPFLSWEFNLRDEQERPVGSVSRNFVGFTRELFTDTGVYALRMDSAAQTSAIETAQGQEVARYEREATAMTLDQRAVMLATAVSIDFDYFSRHSGHGSGLGFMPLWFPGMGGGAAGGAAAEGGAVEGAAGAAGAAGRAGGAVGAAEGGMAGAGTMAGYEAMQRGAHGQQGGDDASPTANEPFAGDGQYPQQGQSGSGSQPGNDVWGEDDDPWGGDGGDGAPPPSAGGEGGESGGGWLDSISEFFGD